MLQMLSSSQGSVGCRVIGGWLPLPRKELNEEFTSRIAVARLGPILVKYLQNLSAISTRSFYSQMHHQHTTWTLCQGTEIKSFFDPLRGILGGRISKCHLLQAVNYVQKQTEIPQ